MARRIENVNVGAWTFDGFRAEFEERVDGKTGVVLLMDASGLFVATRETDGTWEMLGDLPRRYLDLKYIDRVLKARKNFDSWLSAQLHQRLEDYPLGREFSWGTQGGDKLVAFSLDGTCVLAPSNAMDAKRLRTRAALCAAVADAYDAVHGVD